LTIRPTDKWIQSVTRHFKNHHIPAHEWFYGVETAVGNENVYIQRYESHNKEVQEYFKDRPSDLLVLDLSKEDGWSRLCAFLGEERPPFAFPRQNTSRDKKRQFVLRLSRYLKRKARITLYGHNNNEGILMKEGVSSMFLRDMVHFHYSVYECLWQAVERLNDAQFDSSMDGNGSSISNLLAEQIEEEVYWLQQIMEREEIAELGETSSHLAPIKKDDMFQRWHDHMRLMRLSVARLTDETCNGRIGSNNTYTWEALIHIITAGIERRMQVQHLLGEHNVSVNFPSFIGFFRPEKTF
jgi:hypothetical protein